MSDVAIILILALVVLTAGILKNIAKRNPAGLISGLFFRTGFGPRTDVMYMTRSELFKSALVFICFGVLSIFIIFLFQHFSIFGNIQAGELVLMFSLSLFATMGISGGIYLCIRGLCRRKNYIPPSYEEQE